MNVQLPASRHSGINNVRVKLDLMEEDIQVYHLKRLNNREEQKKPSARVKHAVLVGSRETSE